MYTLENNCCDCIRKVNGKWGFYRNLPQAEFGTRGEAETALEEIRAQGLYTADIEVVLW